MPPKAKNRGQRSRPASKGLFERIRRPVALLAIAAASSPISQATLSPVFGAIPFSINHKQAIIASSILAFTLRYFFKGVPSGRIAQWTAIWVFWVPVVQYYLFRWSGTLGPAGGPALIGFLSCHTVMLPTIYAVSEALEEFNLSKTLGPYLSPALSAAAGVYSFIGLERWFQATLPDMMAKSEYFNPIQLQLLLGLAYIFSAHSKLVILIVPALLHTGLLNPHFHATNTLKVLNQELQAQNWTLLDRRWSKTGYISVLDNLDMQYRVMRCDHSLLGGEWKATKARRFKGWKVNEPIYAVFEMMEAVRLIESDPPILDSEARALVIGLGIGTAPKAFLSHGINTTIVELDATVHRYAMKHFGLRNNHTAIITDAIPWVNKTVKDRKSRFDYIMHDVFTGGAEPLSLFTETFLGNLRTLLKPNGAIVLNYAGDLTAPLTNRVLNTIDKVFNGQCKIYREPPSEPEEDAVEGQDFTNMVIFCRNTPGPITFRAPTEADFLRSQSRQTYLLPNPNYEIQFPLQGSPDRTQALQEQILRSGDENLWSHQQAESAVKHWHIMRKVVPDKVWELW